MDALSFLQSVSGFAQSQTEQNSTNRPIKLGTIDPAYNPESFPDTLPKVTFDGESTLSGKLYPVMQPYAPKPGDRVMLIPIGTTYCVIGSIEAGDVLLVADGDFTASGSSINLNAPTIGLNATKTTWTPVWTSSGTAPSYGNANINASWMDLGNLAFFRMRIVFGSTTTFGTGSYSFSLPFSTDSVYQNVTVLCEDASPTARYPGSALIQSGSVLRIVVGAGGHLGISNTIPITWASGDVLLVQGMVYKT